MEVVGNRRAAGPSLASSALVAGRFSSADAAESACATPVGDQTYTREPEGVIVLSGSESERVKLEIVTVPENNPYVSFVIAYSGTGKWDFVIYDQKLIMTDHLSDEGPTSTSA